jgi:hypothetical protein
VWLGARRKACHARVKITPTAYTTRYPGPYSGIGGATPFGPGHPCSAEPVMKNLTKPTIRTPSGSVETPSCLCLCWTPPCNQTAPLPTVRYGEVQSWQISSAPQLLPTSSNGSHGRTLIFDSMRDPQGPFEDGSQMTPPNTPNNGIPGSEVREPHATSSESAVTMGVVPWPYYHLHHTTDNPLLIAGRSIDCLLLASALRGRLSNQPKDLGTGFK